MISTEVSFTLHVGDEQCSTTVLEVPLDGMHDRIAAAMGAAVSAFVSEVSVEGE